MYVDADNEAPLTTCLPLATKGRLRPIEHVKAIVSVPTLHTFEIRCTDIKAFARDPLSALDDGPQVNWGTRQVVYERLTVYRTGDESTYLRNLNSAWQRMKDRFRVLHDVGDDRAEISPVVKFLIEGEQVSALTDVYARMAGAAADGSESDGDRDHADDTEANAEEHQ